MGERYSRVPQRLRVLSMVVVTGFLADSAVGQAPPGLSPRVATTVLEQTAGMETASRSAFERGLMPLADYTERLRVATDVRVGVAEVTGDERAAHAALSAHVQSMQGALDRLQRFRQPAAKGWAADVAEARFRVALSELRLARTRDETERVEAARQNVHALAGNTCWPGRPTSARDWRRCPRWNARWRLSSTRCWNRVSTTIRRVAWT